MARYIDADKLCDSLRESYNLLFDIYKKSKDNDSATLCEGQLNTFMECIIRTNTQPTADVVEVVRCPECIYCENMKCTELSDNSGHPLDVAIFDYCSQGIRK